MCPEKERYMRQLQNLLSDYELDEQGQMAPEKAVKDYARSAADQVCFVACGRFLTFRTFEPRPTPVFFAGRTAAARTSPPGRAEEDDGLPDLQVHEHTTGRRRTAALVRLHLDPDPVHPQGNHAANAHRLAGRGPGGEVRPFPHLRRLRHGRLRRELQDRRADMYISRFSKTPSTPG